MSGLNRFASEVPKYTPMTLDHYVPQVHLRNFYSSSKPPLHATRKSDLKSFSCRSDDVCRIENGNTIPYLKEPRVVEEFLLDIEPQYNVAVSKLATRNLDRPSIHAIAGYVAYIMTCAPAAARANSSPLKAQLETVAEILEAQGQLPPSPPAFEGRSLTQLLREGSIRFKIDQKFPRAFGVDNHRYHLALFGNSTWEILHNPYSDYPFFTSDYPVAIERLNGAFAVNRIAPLTPNLAVRIIPDLSLRDQKLDLQFSKLRVLPLILSRAEVSEINKLIVQCAEELVFSSVASNWVYDFIGSNRHFRVESTTEKIPCPDGYFHVISQRIVPYKQGT